MVAHSRDNEEVGMAHKVNYLKPASIFLDNDGAVLVSFQINPKCFQKVATEF